MKWLLESLWIAARGFLKHSHLRNLKKRVCAFQCLQPCPACVLSGSVVPTSESLVASRRKLTSVRVCLHWESHRSTNIFGFGRGSGWRMYPDLQGHLRQEQTKFCQWLCVSVKAAQLVNTADWTCTPPTSAAGPALLIQRPCFPPVVLFLQPALLSQKQSMCKVVKTARVVFPLSFPVRSLGELRVESAL